MYAFGCQIRTRRSGICKVNLIWSIVTSTRSVLQENQIVRERQDFLIALSGSLRRSFTMKLVEKNSKVKICVKKINISKGRAPEKTQKKILNISEPFSIQTFF